VSLKVTDTDGAFATATVMFTVEDAPPTFSSGSDAIAIDSAADVVCQAYVANHPVPLTLATTAGPPIVDPDAAAAAPNCTPSDTITVTWRVDSPPGMSAVIAPPVDGRCPEQAPASASATFRATTSYTAACLYPTDGGSTGTLPRYSVTVRVSDGTSTLTSNALEVSVRSDLRPCIVDTSPPAGHYVIDRSQPQELMVLRTVDDLDMYPPVKSGAQPTFVWSIWRTTDPTWRVVPEHAQASYTLDPSELALGETVRVQVEARDRNDAMMCNPDVACGTTGSCLLPSLIDTCVWATTWELELR
jgi:hypothetical protein